jgi:hypothetical protein
MSKKEKEELMKDMGLYEEWSEGDKSARELYMNEKETERTTTRDIMEDRAKENKEKRDELTDKLETRLKAADAWEDYQSGMSAREALEKNVGQEIKPEDLTSYKEAHELGLDPTKMDERGEEASSFNTDRDYTRNATVQDFFDKHGEDLPFDNARELKGWLDDHGWDIDVNSLNHSVVQEELNELGGNLEKGKDYVSDVADEDGKIRVSSPNSQSDEIDGKTIEGYIEKNDPEDIEFHAKQNGYEDENGNAKVNEYLQEVIGNKERPGEERDLTKGERNDSMALIYDDVESAEGVHTENISQDVERVENEREEATREVNRAGKHLEGEDLTDTDMSQAERDEIVNGDVGSSDSSSREDLMDETIPSSAGDGNRDFTDIPNETTENDTSESVNDDINPDAPTEEEKESAAAEMVGEMFS